MRRAIAILVMLAACGHGKGKEPDVVSRPVAYDCKGHEQQAAKQLTDLAAAPANLTCQADADCQTVALGSVCSDNCSRSVNQAGAKALAAAATASDLCAGYAAGGCTLIHPPCAPPRTPTCVQGACQ